MAASVTAQGNQHRRELLFAAIHNGLEDLIGEAIKNYHSPVVAIVSCCKTEPGRAFLRAMGSAANAPTFIQRDLREALALEIAASVVVPAEMFLPIADTWADGLADAVYALLKSAGVACVVMGADGVMTAGLAPGGDDDQAVQTLSAWVDACIGPVWEVEMQTKSEAEQSRQRRAERRRRFSTN